MALALRDSMVNLYHWAISSAIQAPNSSLKAMSPMRSQRRSLRRRGKEIRKFWTGEEEERKLPIYFRIQAKESTNRVKFKGSWRFQFESPIKTQVKSISIPFLSLKNIKQIQIDVDLYRFREVLAQKCETLKAFENRNDSTIYNEFQPL